MFLGKAGFITLVVVAGLLASGIAVGAPVIVENGSTPAQGLQTVAMTELWRAGGADDDVFFGTLGAIRADSEGQVYLLDGQLSEISVFDRDGELVRTIGREGDGPGEMRGPADMFITPEGVVNVVQSMPGRIVRLTADGLPAGETTYSVDDDNPAQFGVLIIGRAAGDDMILGGIRMVFSGGVNQQTYFLARCDAEGHQKSALLEKKHEVNMAAFALDEGAMDFVWSRVAVTPDGGVVAGPQRNEYVLNVYDAAGDLTEVIKRDYASPPRTDRQKKMARQVIEAVGANYPVPPREITIEETEAVISNLAVTTDGRIWTQTSVGNNQAPDGAWVVLDVFSPAGEFSRQVALQGDHDATRDALFILPDGRLIVVTGALDAWLNQQGATADEESASDGEALEVICYQPAW